MRHGRALRAFLSLIMLVLISGCNYSIAGRSGRMPGGVSSVSIPVFENETRKPDIEGALTAAFTNEFASTLTVSQNGEAVMRGVIRSYELRPVSYTKSDVNQEYRLTVVLSLKLMKEGADGALLWTEDNVTDYEDFTVILTDVIATEEAEIRAFRKIAVDTARNVKDKMLTGF